MDASKFYCVFNKKYDLYLVLLILEELRIIKIRLEIKGLLILIAIYLAGLKWNYQLSKYIPAHFINSKVAIG